MADSVMEHIAALKDEDWGIREDAATALGESRDPRGVRPLIEALRDSDRAVKTTAAHALTAIGDPAVEEVGRCLQDPDSSVQEAAASILSMIGDARVVEPLHSALLSRNWIVRMHAARAVARLADPRSVETLMLLLQDTVPAVRDEAIAALRAIGDQASGPLAEALEHHDWRIRLRATEALCVVKSQAAIVPLVNLLKRDPDTAVRQEAARALGNIGDPMAVDALLDVVNDPRLQVRAIEALGKIGDRRVLPFLFRLIGELKTGDYRDRTPACEDNRYEQELACVEEAIRALARIQDDEAVPVLIKALQSTLIRKEAGDALVQFGQKAVAPLVSQLKHEQDENIRYHVTDTLKQLGWNPNRVRFQP